MATPPVHIGYLVQQFVPEVGAGPARVLEMARRWVRSGARVTVFTAMPNRPEGRIHAEYRGRLFCEESIEGIRVRRSWLYASPKAGFARTLLNNVTFMATGGASAMAGTADVDVLIASSPPFFPHFAGEAVRLVRRLPLVLEVRDLWPDYLVDMGVLRRESRATRLLFGMERALLRRASAVTVVTESFRGRIEAKGVAREQIHVMPAGVDSDSYYRSDERAPLPCMERRDGTFQVGYLGNFGAGQALGTVLDAAERLETRGAAVRFVLVGDGPQGPQLRADLERRGLRNLTIHAPIPKDRTRAFYANCDVCLVPLAPVPVFQETVPSKLFEILACERPVIACVDGEARRIMEASGGGWVTPPGDPDALVEAILRASAAPPEDRARLGASGRAYVSMHYARERIADAYLELLQDVVRQRAGSSSGRTPRSGTP